MNQQIDEMYAFIVIDDDGSEGIPATKKGDWWFPLVGADMARVNSLRPVARELARKLGKSVELVRFTTREHLETIEPLPDDH